MTTTNDHMDSLLRRVAGLTAHEPDPQHTERLRARCHGAMTRRQWKRSHPGFAPADRWPRLIETTAVVTLSAIYLLEVVRRTLLLYGF